jgi:hypothetical protein
MTFGHWKYPPRKRRKPIPWMTVFGILCWIAALAVIFAP